MNSTSFIESFVNMSYMYYSVFGSIVTITVGIIVSLCTTSEEYDRKLIHPFISRQTESVEKPNKVIIKTVPTLQAVPEKY